MVFDIAVALDLIERAVKPFPRAAMFELAARGYADPFQQLVACIISIRTRDETSLPLAERLLTVAPSAKEMAELPIEELTRILAPSTFARRKAVQIQSIARRVAEQFAGNLPCDRELLLSFAGVGIKCANLTLGIACGEERMSVDVHVHRIVNRWGYVSTPSPEATTKALELEMPSQYWVRTNALLVPFGKHICTGQMPRCSTCPVLEMCAQHGVTRHR